MDIEILKKKICAQKKNEKFLLMNPYVVFDSDYEIIAFAPTEIKAKEAAIIQGNHFPIIIDIRMLCCAKTY